MREDVKQKEQQEKLEQERRERDRKEQAKKQEEHEKREREKREQEETKKASITSSTANISNEAPAAKSTEMTEDDAVIKIQSVYRGYKVRKEITNVSLTFFYRKMNVFVIRDILSFDLN
jgi:hypothetical protein